MQTQIEQLVELLPLFTFACGLIYFSGRWYIEWYYNQFSANYRSLSFGYSDYIFGSWNTLFTAFFSSMTLVNLSLNLLIRPQWYWIVISIILSLVAIIILTIWPFSFDPGSSFIQKILGAREFCLYIVGFFSLAITILVVQNYEAESDSLFSELTSLISNNFFPHTTAFIG